MANAKKYDDLTFTDDFMFCKVMTTNPELCHELLELILGKKVGAFTRLDQQKPIEMTADGKGIRFDVYSEDDSGIVYDCEMQTSKKDNLPKRTRYYQGMIDLNLLERGADYKELKKSYVINFRRGYTSTHLKINVKRYQNLYWEMSQRKYSCVPVGMQMMYRMK